VVLAGHCPLDCTKRIKMYESIVRWLHYHSDHGYSLHRCICAVDAARVLYAQGMIGT